MFYSSWRCLAAFAIVFPFCAFGSQLASAQTQIVSPTATTQIVDFRVADGTWEVFEQRTLTARV